ncbi:iron complex outermembrane receptor protein [Marinilabilia salmonicolor]|jgi:iron complex outermembrane receptor protein|nr:iron complex outermembrane receptor protein [Marinilabilia salmonicolor]
MMVLNMKSVFLWLLLLVSSGLTGQSSLSLQGVVTCQHNDPLPGAVVHIKSLGLGTVTDEDGAFLIKNISSGKYVVEVSFLGYEPWLREIDINEQVPLHISLQREDHSLNEVVVEGTYRSILNREDSRSVAVVDRKFIEDNRSGSLMQTLRRLPGISSIDIGSGQSKPLIRGLGFDRVVVAENGVAHQGQQWGADHGLEIDQYGVENVEVIKGPASLMYGSGAIGGVIEMRSFSIPGQNSSGVAVDLTGRSNNQSIGGSVALFKRWNHLFLRARVSAVDYADYRVPADSIEYYSYYFRLHDGAMRNTAGYENNGNLALGWTSDKLTTRLTVSQLNGKSGFFANAHGLEIRTSSIDYDRSSRTIDLPYQQVRHRKVTSNTTISPGAHQIRINAGWQHNLREEFSEAVAHGYMPKPPDNLERWFQKETGSVNVRWKIPEIGRHNLTVGGDVERQVNEIDGWGFIIPAFESTESGLFIHDKIFLTPPWVVNAGIRYDFSRIQIEPHRDWFVSPGENGEEYILRAPDADRDFSFVSWALGVNYHQEKLFFKLNLGNGFRMPLPKELAANGMNYHMYRYEEGDINLSPEVSWQLDAAVGQEWKSFGFEINPFWAWFPNYIYLGPEGGFEQGLQSFKYQENEVFRAGGELMMQYRISDRLKSALESEYVYSRQLTGDKEGFTLPFSPPWTTDFSLEYTHPSFRAFENLTLRGGYRFVAAQNEIVPPEKKTPGYGLTSILAGASRKVGAAQINWRFQIRNLFDVRYLDHTSFYRLIEAPGPGRNFIVSMSVSF